jgi:hypothetical protein
MSVQRHSVVVYSNNAKTTTYAYPIGAIASLISSTALRCSKYCRRSLRPGLRAVKPCQMYYALIVFAQTESPCERAWASLAPIYWLCGIAIGLLWLS